MKASELRIGNYHLYKIVDVMDERQEWWESCKTDIHDLIILDKKECPNYAPIPLTEEWLLKFGFEKQKGKIDIFEKSRLRIWIAARGQSLCYLVEENTTSAHYIPNSLEHVHQLQNLYFALTGEELAI